ncbi:NDR1/HIN1-like protein 1 [Phragmites australis]|uniref:NDR1/HIN1-like protein 1 n=1 Tax=Phragmites australis TaxID=29695 RepID=UPI002D7926C0|nr:NDR1/HIN1-like protein 1 [Phragmites australis]
MSIKYCDQHKDCEQQRLHRRYCAAVVAIILIVHLIVLTVWLVLRPTKPRFYLNDVAIVCINVSSSSYLTVTMQATLAARNPNDRVGIYYDRLDAFAEYRGLQITVPTALPPAYQGHLDASVWSPFLSAANVPLPPYLAEALTQDETAGYLLVTIRVDGWIRWKAGAFITSHYHLRVRCPALLTVNDGQGSYGSNTGGGLGYFKFQRAAACVVDV